MATTIPIPTNNQVLDGSNHFQLPWFMFLLQLATQAASSGDVSQNGSVTAGHLAVWAADFQISDGGPVPTGNTTATYLTAGNESADLPNSRELLAGVGISFDDSVANQRTIDSTSLCYVPLSLGVEPLQFVSDGAGNAIEVLYVP